MTGRRRLLRLGLLVSLLLALGVPAVQAQPGGGDTLVWSPTTTLRASAAQPYGATLERYSAHDQGRPLTVLVPRGRITAIVVVLHGFHLSAADAEHQVNLAAAAARAGWVVAYPSGTDGSWNAGICCGASSDREVDDTGYVAGVVHDARLRFGPGVRLPSIGIGFSNGAMELADVACQRAGSFDALELVNGDLQDPNCSASRTRQVVQVLSDTDSVVPVAGGASAVTGTIDLPDSAGVNAFSNGLRCTSAVAATAALAEQRITCSNGDALDRVRLRAGRHAWSTRASATSIDETAVARTLIAATVSHTRLPAVVPAAGTCRLGRTRVDPLAAALDAAATGHCARARGRR